ncbi:MAG: hypothetical protein LBT37_08815 [Lactobacillaceae bacterium]|nr:hypothetical protein [Lactobacillaceae bacterium]
MKLHNVLMKSLALGAVVVSLSPLASVATLAHADGTVKSTLGDGIKVLTTKPVDWTGIEGGATTDRDAAGHPIYIHDIDEATQTITVSSNHLASLDFVIKSKEDSRDIFAGLGNLDDAATSLSASNKIKKVEVNVPATVYQNTHAHDGYVDYNGRFGEYEYRFGLRDVDLTGKNEVVLTFYAKDTGLSCDYTSTVHIKRTF